MTLQRLSTALVCTLLLVGCYAGTDDLPAQPRSLAGTEVDGNLHAVAGTFVFDAEARRAFDYFLTADDELDREQLGAWVRAELAARLPEAARDDGYAAWQAYVDYRSDAAALLADPSADLTLVESRLHALIREQLGDYPIATAEQDQISTAFALKRALARTGDDRDVALAPISPSLTGTDAGQFLAGHHAAELARLAGADKLELQQIHHDHFGAAAADRLAALDARRGDWNRRVAAFQAARAELTSDADITALEREQFTELELRRLHALERISAE